MSLQAVVGPMFAGKTSSVVRKYTANTKLGRSVVIVKPSFDNRYAEDHVVTHDGLVAPAIKVRSVADIDRTQSVYIFDEIQFFDEPMFSGDVVALIMDLRGRGCTIFVHGLDLDWKGDPFPVTSRIVNIADSTLYLTAQCAVAGCQRCADRTYLKTSCRDGTGAIRLGGHQEYEARCTRHWQDEGAAGAVSVAAA